MNVRKWIKWIAIATVFFCNAVTMLPALAAENVPQEVLDLRKSVVRIVCYAGEDVYTGSGFAIGTEEPISYVVTNNHVVEGTDEIVIMRSKDLFLKAAVVASLPFSDLCILKLDDPLYDTPPVVLADEEIAQTGEAVYSLGFPGAADTLSDSITGNAEDVTLTDGIISSVRSLTLVEGSQPIRLLQINAAINHGNSGGPLVNKEGQVIGINSYGAADSQDINGAISILELIDALKQKGISYQSSLPVKQAAAQQNTDVPLDWKTIAILAMAVLFTIGAVLAFIGMVGRRKNKAEVNGVRLEDYLLQWGGRLPFEMAIQILAPVLKQLVALHAQGFIHLDICPERILVKNTTQGFLLPPSAAQDKNRIILNPGFAAPEQYQAESRLGPWTDIYSIAAILFFMVTGKRPQGVLQRQLEEDSISNVLGSFGLSPENKSFIEASLAINAAERPQNALALLHALRIAYDPDKYGESQFIRENRMHQKKAKPRRLNKKAVLITAAVLLAIVIPSALLKGWMSVKAHYENALAYVDEQDYNQAYEEWKKIPKVYKDTAQLGQYIFANIEIDYKNFKKAESRFEKLGEYRDSKEMKQETFYQEALFLLDRQAYGEAREIFKSLDKYKDSATMLLEVDYREADAFFKNQEFEKARAAYRTLSSKNYKESYDKLLQVEYGYAQWYFEKGEYEQAIRILASSTHKDAKAKQDAIKDLIYEKGQALYHSGAYNKSKEIFTLLDSYKQSIVYKFLCDAHDTMTLDYKSKKLMYNALKEMATFEDARAILASDDFIFYHLEGKWKNGRDFFSVAHTDADWNASFTLPGYSGEFEIRDGTYYVGTRKVFLLQFISENQISVYCYKNNREYILKRS